MIRTIDHKSTEYKKAIHLMETLHDSIGVRFKIRTLKNGCWHIQIISNRFGEKNIRNGNFVDAVTEVAKYLNSKVK